ncbi:MAG TPA: decaprenyl-phosphate phosphoribosyltransferase [Clostridia bacterium]|nr:decaprenyl-phosphate phosphoribosyltransferase [Clostridia bacterium]
MEEARSLTGWMKLKSYLQLLRPKQWIKNLFIFAALMFSRSIDKPLYILAALYAFLCFCITSSVVYIFNDLLDIEKDRRHPRKKKRPLAAGDISRGEAKMLIMIMLPAAVVFSFALNYSFGLIIAAYLLNNLLYTLYVKNLVILDVMSIAIGFILRVAGGAVVIGVLISPWLLLCTFLLALFLGFNKRRNELLVLQEDAQSHRRILEHYSLDFIDNMLSIVTASTLISYSMYTFFSSDDKYSMVTILFVLYGIFRYQYIIYNKKLGESPEEIVLTDRPLLINILLWIGVSIVILYK